MTGLVAGGSGEDANGRFGRSGGAVLTINLKAVKALGLVIPENFPVGADHAMD
ncbi:MULTISPECIES: hypothetical protein [Bradyrhizobium]|uniref:hypothetical protein n=1 Tax=Bradyrhizobium TaxID=374 RepID=UPI001375105E|nr:MULTISPECIES: hypothetical protein [Bradyrhizobium]